MTIRPSEKNIKMEGPILDNKRIAKNTFMLYIRMFLVMGVSLFTSREVLRILGVEDFGIYNLVGGVIVLFSFLNNAMISATQRFLNFELGRNDLIQASRIFSMSVNVHTGIAFLVFLGGETVGLWFFNTYLNIPIERKWAADLVYQFSIFASILNIMRAPYNACIIAYERMSSFAIISIVEVILKLLIVYLLLLCTGDKLILYAILTTAVALAIGLCFYFVCINNFSISRYKWFWNKDLFKRFLNFSTWSLLGNIANIGAFQGVAIIQNMFCGVLVNAAMGIANQVNAAVYSFASNFQLAFNPQITKSYAAQEWSHFLSLIFRTSRFSFLLLFLISVPVLTYCSDILSIWLGNVPDYAVSFCRLIIFCSLIDCIAAPLWMGIYASGKIQNYQLWISIILLLNIPFSYCVLSWGFNVEATLIVRIALNVVSFLFRLFYLRHIIPFPIGTYAKQVLLPCIYVCALVIALTSLFMYLEEYCPMNIIIKILTSILITTFAICFAGTQYSERAFFKESITHKLQKYDKPRACR